MKKAIFNDNFSFHLVLHQRSIIYEGDSPNKPSFTETSEKLLLRVDLFSNLSQTILSSCTALNYILNKIIEYLNNIYQSTHVFSFILLKLYKPSLHFIKQYVCLKGLFHPPFLARVVSWLAFVVAIFMAHENGDKQRLAKRRHVQGMLDETEPLIHIKLISK